MISIQYWCNKCWEYKYPAFLREEDAPDVWVCPECDSPCTKGPPDDVDFGSFIINTPIGQEDE